MERPEKKEKTLVDKLFEDRILFLGAVTSETSLMVNMQLLYLESLDNKRDIFIFIDSPGGLVSAGLSIYDTMNFISCDVWTVCFGIAASMSAFLLAGGTKGKRVCLPNSTVMLHQPLQQFGRQTFQATEIQIAAREMMRTRERLNRILSKKTGQPIERINEDTERDFWMSAQEALDYGIVDVIAETREDISRVVRQSKTQGGQL